MSGIDPRKPSFSQYRPPVSDSVSEEDVVTRTEPSFTMNNDTPTAQGQGQTGQNQQDMMQQVMAMMAQLLAKQQEPSGFALKLPTPERYDGTRSTKVIENWVASVERYLKLSQYKNNPGVWHTFAASLFSDNAAIWWRKQEEDGVVIDSWQQFVHKLMDEFKPRNAKQAARDRLAALRQTTTIEAYLNEFRDIWLELPSMTEEEAYDRFWRNLAPRVRKDVMTPDYPKSFDELAQRAIAWEAAQATEDAIEKGLPRPESHPQAILPPSSNNGVVPMDLDVINQRPTPQLQGRNNMYHGGYHNGFTNSPQGIQLGNSSYNNQHHGQQGLYYHGDFQSQGPPQQLYYTGNQQHRFSRQPRFNQGPTCFQCGGRGHVARVCPSGKSSSGKGKAWRT